METHSHDHYDQELPIATDSNSESSYKPLKAYFPLIVIALFSCLIPITKQIVAPHTIHSLMNEMMGNFLIFLALFKFFDLKGFVDKFATYDLITKRLKAYGYLYPLIELGLGLAYLTSYAPVVINTITAIVMSISALGVIKSVLKGKKIKCACLGTVLNVPLSTVSIVENVGMGLMAAFNLFYI